MSLLVFIIILSMNTVFLVSNGIASVTEDSVDWPENIRKSLRISWVVVQASGTPTFGGQTLTNGDRLNFTFIQNPSSQFSQVFGDQIPSWIEIHYQGTKLDNSMFSPLEIIFLNGFIFPISFTWDNGSQSSLQSFLEQYKPESFNSSAFSGSTTVWNKDIKANSPDREVTYIEIITQDMGLGFAAFASLHFNHDAVPSNTYHYMFEFQGDMKYDEEEEEPGDTPTSIKWHESAKKDTIFAWNVTEYGLNTGGSFSIGGTIIKAGDVIQFALVKNPPTNPQEWLDPDGPPDWINLLINTNQIDLSKIEEEGEMLMFLLLPIEGILENGSKIDLRSYFDGSVGDDDDLMNYHLEIVNGTYFDVTWRSEWDDEGETGFAEYHVVTTIATGITVLFEVNATEGHFTWEYLEEAANVDPVEGETKTMESEYSVELSYPPPEITPGFEFFTVLLLISCITIFRKRK